jgi:hypothetical protein
VVGAGSCERTRIGALLGSGCAAELEVTAREDDGTEAPGAKPECSTAQRKVEGTITNLPPYLEVLLTVASWLQPRIRLITYRTHLVLKGIKLPVKAAGSQH